MSTTERRETATMLLFQQHREANRPHRYKAERLRDERDAGIQLAALGAIGLFVFFVLPFLAL